jgi:hypothetical protein
MIRLAAVILVGGVGQAVARGCPDPLVDQARSVEFAQVGQHLAGHTRVAHDVGLPGAEPDLHQVAVGGPTGGQPSAFPRKRFVKNFTKRR